MYIILADDHGAYEDPKHSTSPAFFTEVAPFNDLTITVPRNQMCSLTECHCEQ